MPMQHHQDSHFIDVTLGYSMGNFSKKVQKREINLDFFRKNLIYRSSTFLEKFFLYPNVFVFQPGCAYLHVNLDDATSANNDCQSIQPPASPPLTWKEIEREREREGKGLRIIREKILV